MRANETGPARPIGPRRAVRAEDARTPMVSLASSGAIPHSRACDVSVWHAASDRAGRIVRVVRGSDRAAARRPELDLRLCCQESSHLQAESRHIYTQEHPLRAGSAGGESCRGARLADAVHRAPHRIDPVAIRRLTARRPLGLRRAIARSVDVYQSFWGLLPEPASVNARANPDRLTSSRPPAHACSKPFADAFLRKIRASASMTGRWHLRAPNGFCAFTSMDWRGCSLIPAGRVDRRLLPQVDRWSSTRPGNPDRRATS